MAVSAPERDMHPMYDVRNLRRHVLRLTMVCATGVGLACSSDQTGPGLTANSQLYYRLTLNHHAILMAATAPYDTLQLQATPYAADGSILTDTGVTTYTSADTFHVKVSSTGLLTAIADAGNANINVIVKRTLQGTTLADTAVVRVQGAMTIPQFTQLTLAPYDGDSTVLGLSDWSLIYKSLSSSALDQNGASIANALILYRSSDPLIVTFDDPYSPNLHGFRVGVVTLYADATIYGVHIMDSLRYTVGYPIYTNVEIRPHYAAGSTMPTPYFEPGTITVNVGAIVAWYSDLPNGMVTDITFDTPNAAQATDSEYFAFNFPAFTWYQGGSSGYTNAVIPAEGGGNIPSVVFDSVCVGDTFDNGCNNGNSTYFIGHARTFPTAGTYPFHSTRYGISGVVNVVRNP